MKISARNQLKGTVKQIVDGAVNCEVTVALGDGQEVVSVITKSAVERLKLKVGAPVCAIVKASSVMLGAD